MTRTVADFVENRARSSVARSPVSLSVSTIRRCSTPAAALRSACEAVTVHSARADAARNRTRTKSQLSRATVFFQEFDETRIVAERIPDRTDLERWRPSRSSAGRGAHRANRWLFPARPRCINFRERLGHFRPLKASTLSGRISVARFAFRDGGIFFAQPGQNRRQLGSAARASLGASLTYFSAQALGGQKRFARARPRPSAFFWRCRSPSYFMGQGFGFFGQQFVLNALRVPQRLSDTCVAARGFARPGPPLALSLSGISVPNTTPRSAISKVPFLRNLQLRLDRPEAERIRIQLEGAVDGLVGRVEIAQHLIIERQVLQGPGIVRIQARRLSRGWRSIPSISPGAAGSRRSRDKPPLRSANLAARSRIPSGRSRNRGRHNRYEKPRAR